MGTLFALFFVLSPLALVAGLIKPSWVLSWDKTKTKRRAGLTYSISTIVFLVLAGCSETNTTLEEVVSSPPTSSPQEVVSSPPTPSIASKAFSECENFVDQADAQESFDSGNRFNLEDNDGDGIACEETTNFSSQLKTGDEIKEEVAEQTSSQDKAPQYIAALVEELEKFPSQQRELGMGTVQSWSRDAANTQAAYESDCQELQEGASTGERISPEEKAQEAYAANEYSQPYEQYEAWYKARSQALQKVGCQP